MKFTTTDIVTNGTSYQGLIKATYLDLVDVFGPPAFGPHDNSGDKVTCEWVLEFDDGTAATIYDWNMVDTTYALYDWHIGGFDQRAVELVTEVYTQHTEKV